MARLALIAGVAVVSALLLSTLVVASHQFAFALQETMSDWK